MKPMPARDKDRPGRRGVLLALAGKAVSTFHQETENMSGVRLRVVVGAAGLVMGASLGMAGSFVPSAELRGLAWGIDGIAIVVGCALLAVHHLRLGDDQLAAGFLVFLAAETLIVSSSAMTLEASAPSFGAAPACGLQRWR
jgi:hypothetical protein